MPTNRPNPRPVVVPPIRGDEAYGRFLDRVLKAEQKAGSTVRTRTELVEIAVNALALGRHGLKAPPRAKPLGSNQHGEPKPG